MKHISLHRNSELAVILFATALLILCGNAAMAMSLNSPAFQQNGHIPSRYTCEAEDVSPPLAWEGVPNGAKSLVLIIDDPDAPDPKAPKMVWVHWVVYNMPPDTKSLPENAGKARLPQGTLLGVNDFNKTGYGGPCPPIGRHRYFHKLYALDITSKETRRNRRSSEQCRVTYSPMRSSSVQIKRVTGSLRTPRMLLPRLRVISGHIAEFPLVSAFPKAEIDAPDKEHERRFVVSAPSVSRATTQAKPNS